jgi:butyrate kinase
MLTDLRIGEYGIHASNLGALLAFPIAQKWSVSAFIVDPITSDDFPPVARISGVPGIERKSRSHALNIKYCYYKQCNDNNLESKDGRFIICHFGSGFSIAAVVGGKIIDVNDALLGMGPFSVERAGALPLASILSLAYNRKLSQKESEKLLTKESGLAGYVGTNDFREIEKRLQKNDSQAQLVFDGMLYQISKEMGACLAVLKGQCDGIILTGGLTQSEHFVNNLKERISFAGDITVYPGSFELEALASGAERVLNHSEQAKIYQ